MNDNRTTLAGGPNEAEELIRDIKIWEDSQFLFPLDVLIAIKQMSAELTEARKLLKRAKELL
jgi:hypothetical protein